MNYQYKAITLNSFSKEDYCLLQSWLNQPEIAQNLGIEKKLSLDETLSFYQVNDLESPYMIIYNHQKIGFIYLEEFTKEQNIHHNLEESAQSLALEMAIGELSMQHNGIGCEAIEALLQLVDGYYSCDYLVLDTLPDHTQAINCYKKNGFKDWGILRKHEFRQGLWIDNLLMGIDFREQTSRSIQTI